MLKEASLSLKSVVVSKKVITPRHAKQIKPPILVASVNQRLAKKDQLKLSLQIKKNQADMRPVTTRNVKKSLPIDGHQSSAIEIR